jgi:cytoskeletal protein RodZ
MSTVAEQLRRARQAQNLTLQQVGEITKIRTDHLSALEEGNLNVFPAAVYIRGFVRTYSTLLKLDVPQVMAALETELAGNKRFAEATAGAQPPRGLLDFLMLQLSKMNWRTGLALLIGGILLVAFGLGYLIYQHQRSADPLKDLKPGVYRSTQSLSGETLPMPSPKR